MSDPTRSPASSGDDDFTIYIADTAAPSFESYDLSRDGQCQPMFVMSGETCKDPDCPLKSWANDCQQAEKEFDRLVLIADNHEAFRLLYHWIFWAVRDIEALEREAGKPLEASQKWWRAVGGLKDFSREFGKTTITLRNLMDKFNAKGKELGQKLGELIQHCGEAPKKDGTRLHGPKDCCDALALVPAAFYGTVSGLGWVKQLDDILVNDEKTYGKSDLARFIGSVRVFNHPKASGADLLDDTVFESFLTVLDKLSPTIGGLNMAKIRQAVPSFKLDASILLGFFNKRLVIRGSIDDTMVLQKFVQWGGPDRIEAFGEVRPWKPTPEGLRGLEQAGGHMISPKSEVGQGRTYVFVKSSGRKRIDSSSCQILNTILNLYGFYSALDSLEQDRSLKATITTVKEAAELTSSIIALAESRGPAWVGSQTLKTLRTGGKALGFAGLLTEAGLSLWDSVEQLDATLTCKLPGGKVGLAHLTKAVGAGLMLYSLPIGGVIYLLGMAGILAFDYDPYYEWLIRTPAASKFTNTPDDECYQDERGFNRAKASLLALEKIMGITGEPAKEVLPGGIEDDKEDVDHEAVPVAGGYGFTDGSDEDSEGNTGHGDNDGGI